MHSGCKARNIVEILWCFWTLSEQMSPHSVVQWFSPAWSHSVADQDAAEAQRDRLWVQVCPKGEAISTTANNQQLLLIWQKDTAMIM